MADYILNLGGRQGPQDISAVDIFKITENGIEHITDHGLSLSVARTTLAAASCGEYVLAMGGLNGSDRSNAVDVFKVTTNGVEKVTDHGLSLSEGRGYLAAASCGNYILAMGGVASSERTNTVDVFQVTTNGIEHVTDHGLSLSEGRGYLSAASCGEYVLAMGGYTNGDISGTVDVFKVSENGIEHIQDHGLSLSVGRGYLSAASCGEYVLAMGGNNGSSATDAVDVFKVTTNGVEKVTDHGLSLSVARDNLAAASCGEYVLAMGGLNGSDRSNAVDVFQVTANGVEHVTDHGLTLSIARSHLAAASVGNYVLAMGGEITSSATNAVDVFQVL